MKIKATFFGAGKARVKVWSVKGFAFGFPKGENTLETHPNIQKQKQIFIVWKNYFFLIP